MFKKYITLILFVSFLFMPIDVTSQGGTPCNTTADCPQGQACNNGGRCRPVVGGVPIDGGVVILLAAGIVFGVKKLIDSKKLLS